MMKMWLMMVFLVGVINYNKKMVVFYSNFFMILMMFLILGGMKSGSGVWMIYGYFSVDMISFLMILLSFWVISLMYFSVLGDHDWELDSFKVCTFICMIFILVGFFSAHNLVIFYLFFELSLLPTFFIVLYWGASKERLVASLYLMLYMMFISFPFLYYVMSMNISNFSGDFMLMGIPGNFLFKGVGSWSYFLILGAFLIKLPIYLFHAWLPKAHVEAPVYGSMLLAAILLKLGGYGLIRLVVFFLEESLKFKSILISVSVIGAVYVSLMCLVQVDLKSLVALSSVVHMNFMVASLMSLTKVGLLGGFISLISHGFCSSGLFYLVNSIYSRTSSRLMVINKGVMGGIPFMGGCWFLLCASNFSFPFSLNFLGEIFMIMAVLDISYYLMIGLMLICFFSGAYSLYLYSYLVHGSEMNNKGVFMGSLMSEYISVYMHYLPLFFMFFFMNSFMY